MADIPYYAKFLSPRVKHYLLQRARPVKGVAGLQQLGESGGLESREALQFLCELHDELLPHLNAVLDQREVDRAFIDQRCRALMQFNQDHGRDYQSADYQTVVEVLVL